MSVDISAIRKRAWQTRRQKYGTAGHSSSYQRSACSEECAALRQEVEQLRREKAKAFYDHCMAASERRFSGCAASPRLFIRQLREFVVGEDGEVEFALTEGMATAMLAERESSLAFCDGGRR